MFSPPHRCSSSAAFGTVDDQVAQLVTAPGVLDLEGASATIDFASQLVLAPELVLDTGEEDSEESGDTQ